MIKKFLVGFVFFSLVYVGYSVQFEFVGVGVKNIATGGNGVSFVKDPFSLIINSANLSFEKSRVDLYYEAYSFVNINSLIDLYSKRFMFDPVGIGASFRLDEFSRLGFLYSSLVYDFDYPEILYKTLLFGYSRRVLPYLYIGMSGGPVVGLSEFANIFSFLGNLGLSLRFDSFVFSFSFRSPFSVNYFSPTIGEVYQFFPPILFTGGSIFVDENIVVLFSLNYFFLNDLLILVDSKEIFSRKEGFFDSFSFGVGGIYYDDESGYRVMLGFYRSAIELVSVSIPQYHLTAGATFFIRLPGFNNDFEVNFTIDDLSLLNFLNIAPQNFRKISLYVSVEFRL